MLPCFLLGDDSQLNGTRVIAYVKTAKLSDDEVQTLIDILLNKQGLTPSGPIMTDDSWNKVCPLFLVTSFLSYMYRFCWNIYSFCFFHSLILH